MNAQPADGKTVKTQVIQRTSDPTASRTVIDVRNLSKQYGDVRAVSDLSFTVEEGRIAGFLGPNGSGKTTTLRSILGLVTPTSGTATINGHSYRDLANPLHTVGAMLEAAAHPGRSARNHLRMIAAEAHVSRARVDEVLTLVELDRAADRRVGGYSLGMHQRLGLAAALLGDPAILILDEPANGLDPEGIRWLRDFLRGLAAQGRTILLSSHVLAEVAQTVDDVVVISKGSLVVSQPLEQLMAEQARRSVRARVSDPDRLVAALVGQGASAAREGDHSVVVSDVSSDVVGKLAFDLGIAVFEIAAEIQTLESTFFELTQDKEPLS